MSFVTFVSVVFVVSLVVFHLSPCSSHHFFSSRFVLVELGTENYETAFGETDYVEYEIDLSHEVQNFPVGTSAFWLLLLPQQNAPKPDVITQAITRPWVEIVGKVDASLKTPHWWLFTQDARSSRFGGVVLFPLNPFLFPTTPVHSIFFLPRLILLCLIFKPPYLGHFTSKLPLILKVPLLVRMAPSCRSNGRGCMKGQCKELWQRTPKKVKLQVSLKKCLPGRRQP